MKNAFTAILQNSLYKKRFTLLIVDTITNIEELCLNVQ